MSINQEKLTICRKCNNYQFNSDIGMHCSIVRVAIDNLKECSKDYWVSGKISKKDLFNSHK